MPEQIPASLNTDAFIPFAGGTGREIWAMACAAREGDLDTLASMLDEKPDLVHCGTYGLLARDCYRPLHFAIYANQPDTVAFLLNRGAHVLDEFHLNSINQSLEIAVAAGHTRIVVLLDTNRRQRFGYRSEAKEVTAAIEARDPARALELVDADPDLVNATDDGGNAPIHLAVMSRQLDLVRELSARGANLDHTRFNGARPVDLVRGDYWFNHRVSLPEAVQEPAVTIGFLLGLGAEYTLCTAIQLGDMERVQQLHVRATRAGW